MFPLIYLLYVYAFFALFGLVFLFFNIYHLAKFGLQNFKTYVIILVYLVIFLGTISASLVVLATIDWSDTIDVKATLLDIINTESTINTPLL